MEASSILEAVIEWLPFYGVALIALALVSYPCHSKRLERREG